jgi:hypothetical protein
MNLISWSFLKKCAVAVLALAGVMYAAQVLAGQAVLMSPPPISVKPAAVAEDETNNEMNVFVPSCRSRSGSGR